MNFGVLTRLIGKSILQSNPKNELKLEIKVVRDSDDDSDSNDDTDLLQKEIIEHGTNKELKEEITMNMKAIVHDKIPEHKTQKKEEHPEHDKIAEAENKNNEEEKKKFEDEKKIEEKKK